MPYDQLRALASYVPFGRAFVASKISGTNIRLLLTGIAIEMGRVQELLDLLNDELMPDATTLLIAEWESALGIPDDCFNTAGTIDERRLQILVKMASLGIQTAQDFIDLAALFNVVITSVDSGMHATHRPLFGSDKEARFTIVITFYRADVSKFTYTFPIPFEENNEDIQIMECLFSKLKPANCQLYFKYS